MSKAKKKQRKLSWFKLLLTVVLFLVVFYILRQLGVPEDVCLVTAVGFVVSLRVSRKLWRKKNEKINYNINFDALEGHDFEKYCAALLVANGFTDVKVTRGSGDHGIDVLATYKKKKYAIQCKRYVNTVGNRAVQEAYAGKGIYKTDYAVVMTNSYFTNQAREEADILGVLLWGRKKIEELIQTAR